MTDLDNTQIITADDSLAQNESILETEASLKIISGADSNIYPIGKETIIGRSSPSDLVIPAPSLSKQHAKITISNGQYFITDLGSSNKTFQNKVQLQPNVCYALHNGDEIKFGDIICLFEEHKAIESNKNTSSEPTHESYVPAINTLVEEDSPWPLDDDDDIPLPVVPKTNVDVIPSTQTISDSYEDQEPTQPMKVWNGNSTNRLSRTSLKSVDETAGKQNGVSSSFVPPSTSNNNNNNEDDDGNVVIGGGTTLSATVPLVIEPTQINNDDQLEIVSSSQTKTMPEEENNIVTVETTTTTTTTTTEVEIANTQAYELEPAGEIANTQAYELEGEPVVTDVVETKREEVHQVVVEGNTVIEQITTTTTTTEMIVMDNENIPVGQTLAYDLQPTEETITETTTTTRMIIENENPPVQTLAYDLQPTNEEVNLDEAAPAAVCENTQAYDLNEQVGDESPRPASETMEVVPVSKLVEELENIPEETTVKQQVEVIIDLEAVKEVANEVQMDTDLPTTTESTMNKEEEEKEETTTTTTTTTAEPSKTEVQTTTASPVDLNKSLTESSMETEQKLDETVPTSTIDEIPSSTLETSQTQENEDEVEGDEETDETAAFTTRGQRGVPRRAARRARGRRRGAAARARVVSTRLHGTRRNAALSAATSNTEDNNTTLEETVVTDTEESPKKVTTPVVEQKSVPTTPAEDTPAADSGSNIRVSARIKARASTGRNRQFPYTDDYVDLDDLEKQSKTAHTPSPSTTTRRSTRGGRSSSAPQKRISLRQQPIDASESLNEKDSKQKSNVDVYEQMDTGGENEEPILSTRASGRKRKSTTPVASTTTKRNRVPTPPPPPPAEPVVNTRRKQSSVPQQASPVTPKRGRKSTKTATSDTQSSQQESTNEDRPVRIALSSHLNFDQNHLEILRKLGFEIMDESCHVDALVVDRIRRTKKFFMCLARGAHILSPTWIETMIKENRYVSYEKYYLEDTTAEVRYGFQLRESVRLAKQRPIFENYKFFCTKDTSPPYDDLKDIVEAAGGKFIEKIVNMNKPGKDLICIVAQIHKNEFEDLFKKGVPIVSEEFALSGISKQKLDFDAFSLFQSAAKSTGK